MSLPPGADKAEADRSSWEEPALKDRRQTSTWCVVYPPDTEAAAASKPGMDDDAVSHASSRTVEVMPQGGDGLLPPENQMRSEDCGTPISQLTISPRSPRKVEEPTGSCSLDEGPRDSFSRQRQEVRTTSGSLTMPAQAAPPFYWRRTGCPNSLVACSRHVAEEPKSPPEARLPRDVTLVHSPRVFARTEVKVADGRKGSPAQWRLASSASTALPSNASTSSSASAPSCKAARRVIAYANVPPATTRIQHTASAAAPPRRRVAGNLQTSPRSTGSPIRTLPTATSASPREVQSARAGSPRVKASRTESPKISRTPASLTMPKAPSAAPKVARQESPRVKAGSIPSSAYPVGRPKKGAVRPESPDRIKARRPPGATKEDTRTLSSPTTCTRTCRKSLDAQEEDKALPAGDPALLANLGFSGSRLSLSLSNNSLLDAGNDKPAYALRPLGGGYSLTAPSRTAPRAAGVGSMTLPSGGQVAKSMLVPAAKPMVPGGLVARQHQSHVPARQVVSVPPQCAGSRSWQPCCTAAGYPPFGVPHRIA